MPDETFCCCAAAVIFVVDLVVAFFTVVDGLDATVVDEPALPVGTDVDDSVGACASPTLDVDVVSPALGRLVADPLAFSPVPFPHAATARRTTAAAAQATRTRPDDRTGDHRFVTSAPFRTA
jgi:hypothetical protein